MASRRTWHTHHVGHFHLTIIAEPDAGDHHLERHRNAAAVTQELAELLESCRLTTTWAITDPVHSPIRGLVALSDLPHELAVLGVSDWLGPTVGRTVFARELCRRCSQVRAAGLEIGTIASRTLLTTNHTDLFVKHDIRAVAGSATTSSRNHFMEPRTLHYGVWEFSPTAQLPAPSSWLTSGTRRVYRRIERAATQAATFHLVIDAAAIQPASDASRAVGWILRRVAELSSRGFVQVETMGAAAARLSDVPSVIPQRSILRIAA